MVCLACVTYNSHNRMYMPTMSLARISCIVYQQATLSCLHAAESGAAGAGSLKESRGHKASAASTCFNGGS